MIRSILLGSLCLLVTAGCSETPAPQVASGNACNAAVEAEGANLHAQVYDAKPIYRDEFRARAITVDKLAGAKLYVPAEKGVTDAYLHRVASCYAASSAAEAHPNDPLRPNGGIAAVDIESHRGSYAIAVTSEDEKTAEEIWQRAQALDSQGAVEVEQVAKAQPTTQF